MRETTTESDDPFRVDEKYLRGAADPAADRSVVRRRGRRFHPGCPRDWLAVAMRTGRDRVLRTALAVWLVYRLVKRRSGFSVKDEILEEHRVSRRQFNRGLTELETLGLLTLSRSNGNYRITVIIGLEEKS